MRIPCALFFFESGHRGGRRLCSPSESLAGDHPLRRDETNHVRQEVSERPFRPIKTVVDGVSGENPSPETPAVQADTLRDFVPARRTNHADRAIIHRFPCHLYLSSGLGGSQPVSEDFLGLPGKFPITEFESRVDRPVVTGIHRQSTGGTQPGSDRIVDQLYLRIEQGKPGSPRPAPSSGRHCES